MDHHAFYSACYAPFTSMYLDPRGEVRACCQNQLLRLGNVRESSLRDIWSGEPAQRLRRRLAIGRLDLGCDLCAESGSSGAALLRSFDDLVPRDTSPEWPAQLELALSNACNLQCTMCNGDLSSSIRIHREHRPALPEVYDEQFFEDLDPFLQHVQRLVVLGGEPLLGKEPLRVLESVAGMATPPACHVTTNGTQWNGRVRALLETLPIHVAVSVDGATAATVESIRVGVRFDELRANIDRIIEATSHGRGGCSLTFCLMRTNWHELGQVMAWADSLDVDVYVNSVVHPPSLSLVHVDADELRRVLEALEVESCRREPQLGRNLGAWRRAVASLHELSRRRVAPPGETTVRWRTNSSAIESGSTVVVDQHQIVTGVERSGEDGLHDLPLEELVGSSVHEVLIALTRWMPAVEITTLQRDDDGIEQWLVEFSGPDGRQKLELRSSRAATGGRWQIRAHRMTDDDPGGAAP